MDSTSTYDRKTCIYFALCLSNIGFELRPTIMASLNLNNWTFRSYNNREFFFSIITLDDLYNQLSSRGYSVPIVLTTTRSPKPYAACFSHIELNSSKYSGHIYYDLYRNVKKCLYIIYKIYKTFHT